MVRPIAGFGSSGEPIGQATGAVPGSLSGQAHAAAGLSRLPEDAAERRTVAANAATVLATAMRIRVTSCSLLFLTASG